MNETLKPGSSLERAESASSARVNPADRLGLRRCEAPVSFSGETTGFLVLSTNHPEAKLINLSVEFTSY